MIYELKIEEEYFKSIQLGIKTFELRRNDRNYKVGDSIRFIVPCYKNSKIVLSELYKIIYILENVPMYGLKKGYCILGIKKE